MRLRKGHVVKGLMDFHYLQRVSPGTYSTSLLIEVTCDVQEGHSYWGHATLRPRDREFQAAVRKAGWVSRMRLMGLKYVLNSDGTFEPASLPCGAGPRQVTVVFLPDRVRLLNGRWVYVRDYKSGLRIRLGRRTDVPLPE